MEPFHTYEGKVAILDRADIDTDQIIPKQFLKSIERSGFGKNLFHDWRFLDGDVTQPNPEFTLNQSKSQGAGILLTGENFGCGSSREHAPWALRDYGFRVILAPSFADIFYGNAVKNGILPIRLPEKELLLIKEKILSDEIEELSVDLRAQTIQLKHPTLTHKEEYRFEIESFIKESLIKGLDEIGLSLKKEKIISSFEEKYFRAFPYIIPSERIL